MIAIVFNAGFLPGDDELMSLKGHRSDIRFVLSNKSYELNFITLERLTIELNEIVRKGENSFSDSGLVIVNELNKSIIVNSIQNLVDKMYFETQKPLPLSSIEKLADAFDINGHYIGKWNELG